MIKMYTIKSISISVIADKFNVRHDTLKTWIRKFTDDFKKKLLIQYLMVKSIKSTAFEKSGTISLKVNVEIEGGRIICRVYRIAPSQKLKVVKFCINNNNNFNLCASHFNIPYSKRIIGLCYTN